MQLRCGQIGAMLAVTAFALMVWEARGQNIEPRTYSNIPVGLNFLVVGYGYSVGSVVTDPSFPLEDGDVQIHSTVLAYARAVDVWGTSGKFDVVLPFAWVSGTATFQGEPRAREVSGLADPRFRSRSTSMAPPRSRCRSSPTISRTSSSEPACRCPRPGPIRRQQAAEHWD